MQPPRTRIRWAKNPLLCGHCAYPVGWHFSDGKWISAPAQDSLRATLIVHQNGKVTIRDQVKNLPADTQFAVSGNAMMLTNGHPTPPVKDSGGGTSLVFKDLGTGVFSIINQPFDQSSLKLPIAIERPVVDVIGIKIDPLMLEKPAAGAAIIP